MCGIVGFLNYSSRRPDHKVSGLVKNMTGTLAHRGPDAEGYWVDPKNCCHLGHRRLSIIDLSAAANQPMLDVTSRYAIVFNGEIYNYKDLRRSLEASGFHFRTHSDTEVLLLGFAAYGVNIFSQLDGMFALAIYDTQTRILTLARDRAGEKPLYYTNTKTFFAFASELRPLLKLPDMRYQMSEESLALYMALRYVPAPRTIIEGISKLEPGCVLQVTEDGCTTQQRYFKFDIDDAASAQAQNIDDYADEVEAALESSIRDRLNSDVALGAFLSSGVDSALICALLAKKMQCPLRTYTVGFSGDAGSEHEAARVIAAHIGTEHQEFIFGATDFENICRDIGTLLDEPNGDRSCVPTYLLSQFARQHVKVCISGDSGDELFAGYSRYGGFINSHAGTVWPNAAAISQRYFETALPVFPWSGIAATLPTGFNAVRSFTAAYGSLFTVPGRTMLNALRLLDFETYMPGAVLAKVDRMSMRHGLEVRTPYLSPQILALSSKASLGACVDKGVQKVVLRRLLARYIPKSFALAPKKGFGMPASVFLQNGDRVRAELISALDLLSQTSFFSQRKGSIENFSKSAGSNTNSIWATLVLAKWIESTESGL